MNLYHIFLLSKIPEGICAFYVDKILDLPYFVVSVNVFKFFVDLNSGKIGLKIVISFSQCLLIILGKLILT